MHFSIKMHQNLIKLATSLFSFFLLPGVDIIHTPTLSLQILTLFLLLSSVVEAAFFQSSSTPTPLTVLIETLLLFAKGVVASFILLLIFGCPLQVWLKETALLASYLSALLVFATGYQSANHTINVRVICLTFAGCYVFAFVLPLDWQKNYQKYPIPIAYGGFLGSSFGLIFSS